MNVTLKTGNGSIRILFQSSAFSSVNADFEFIVNVDGVTVGPIYLTSPASWVGVSAQLRVPVSAGTHSVQIFSYIGGGTGYLYSPTLLVEEV